MRGLANNNIHRASDSTFSATQWETALTRHYLRSDGPCGASALSYLDATPEQLAIATGRSTADAENVLREFFSLFHDRKAVRLALAHGVPQQEGTECDGPGWFRYLVLTCVVAAASPELARSNDYRERLQSILAWDSRLLGLSGIAVLWQRLVRWCAEHRAEGEPYRAVELPDPGAWRQIGYSLRVTFPSRGDRRRLATLLEPLHGIESPKAVIAAVRKRLDSDRWSEAFRTVFFDFESRYRNGGRLLIDHAFWRLASELLGSQPHHVDARSQPRLRLFVSIDKDVVLEAQTGKNADFDSSAWTQLDDSLVLVGPVDMVVRAIAAVASNKDVGLSRIAADIQRGSVPFVETAWGTWNWQANPALGRVRVLATDAIKATSSSRLKWHPVAPAWHISNELSPEAFNELFRSSGELVRRDAIQLLELEGGFRTSGIYLGRPEFQPSALATEGAEVVLDAVRIECGHLNATINSKGVVGLTSSGPVAGVWKLTVKEARTSYTNEILLKFVDRALEHDTISTPKPEQWPEEREVKSGPPLASLQIRPVPAVSTKPCDRFFDLLEVVYAGGRLGWAESDLIPILQTFARTSEPSHWDLLRALHEGGFLTPHIAARWRARRWYLTPPKLHLIGDVAILDGAVCQTLRERFLHTVAAQGGSATLRNGIGPWSIPLLVATKIEASKLANDLEIPWGPAELPTFSSAPGCWRVSAYDTQFRQMVSTWDWAEGRFGFSTSGPSPDVNLERWGRAKRDAPDVYALVGAANTITVLSNRTAAVLEAYRRANRTLFRRAGNTLLRNAATGWLPDLAAKRLRFRHLCSPGPIVSDPGNYSYGYPCDDASAHWLSTQFGAAVPHSRADQSILEVAFARRLPRYGQLLNAALRRGAF